MSCDHAIGVHISDDGGFLFLSGVDEAGKRLRRRHEEWAKNPHALPSVIRAKASYTNAQFIASTYSLFAYCPYCGERLPAL